MDENLEANLENKPIKKTACILETQNGDLNSLSLVLEWLKSFANQLKNSNKGKERKTIIIANSYVYLKLSLLAQKEPNFLDEINSLMSENKMKFLFYPTETSAENFHMPLLDNLFWQLVGEYSLRTNPNSRLAFLQVYRQALREIMSKRADVRTWFIRFAQMSDVEAYMSELIPASSVEQESKPALLHSTISDVEMKEEREIKREDSRIQLNESSQESTSGSATNTVNAQPQQSVKLTDSEINEYCQWVDDMSRIGIRLI